MPFAARAGCAAGAPQLARDVVARSAQDGNEAKQVDCDEEGAFSVVSKETKREDCADQAQPFVLIERDGKTEVLCLSPKK